MSPGRLEEMAARVRRVPTLRLALASGVSAAAITVAVLLVLQQTTVLEAVPIVLFWGAHTALISVASRLR